MQAVLAGRPIRYGHSSELALGTFDVIQVTGGAWTVERRIGARRWHPLTQRTDPAWRTWPTFDAALLWAQGGPTADRSEGLFDCAEWPHWGSET